MLVSAKKKKVVAKGKTKEEKIKTKKSVLVKEKIEPKIKKGKESKIQAPVKAETKEISTIGIESMKRVATILADAQVRQRLIDLGGENAIAIVRNFRENYSDEDISKKLEIVISN